MPGPFRWSICAPFLLLLSAWAWCTAADWPQWRGAQRDGVWSESGLLEDLRQLPAPRWKAPVGSGYSAPSISRGKVYLTDRQTDSEQQERVLCFDANTGKPLWKFTYACLYRGIGYVAGPRAAVTVEGPRAYALGAMGHLHCLDADEGKLIWQHDLDREYQISESDRMPNWGLAAAPLVYRDLLIVMVGADRGRSVVAFQKETGQEVWRALDDRGQYSAPILITQGGEPVLVCWTGDSVAGLNPNSGEVHWRQPLAPVNMPIGVATPVIEGDKLFVSSFYDGSLLLRLDARAPRTEVIWRRRGNNEQQTDALHCMMSTPILEGNYIYGVDSYGQLRCLDARTGDRLWEDRTAVPTARWSNIHMVRNGDRTWMFNERGELLLGKLSPQGFQELGRAKLIEPTLDQLNSRGGVCWAHPAFADRHVFVRNDQELICVSLEAQQAP